MVRSASCSSFLFEHDPSGHARGHALRKTGFHPLGQSPRASFSGSCSSQMSAKPATKVLRNATDGVFAMIIRTHRFKVGQTVNLIPSISRIAAQGHFEIVSLRPVEGETPQYRIKNRSELHERVVAETDLVPSAF